MAEIFDAPTPKVITEYPRPRASSADLVEWFVRDLYYGILRRLFVTPKGHLTRFGAICVAVMWVMLFEAACGFVAGRMG